MGKSELTQLVDKPHRTVHKETGEPYWRRRARIHPEKVHLAKRTYALKSKYGITYEEYLDLLDSQGCLCDICGIILTQDIVKNVCIDHCHKTGKIRGVLCGRCNKALGLVDDSIYTLKEMITYLA